MASDPCDLLIDAASLRNDFDGLEVIGDMNMFPTGERKGGDDDIPRRGGLVPVPALVLASFSFEIEVRIAGATRGQRIARLIAISTALTGPASDGLTALTMVLPNAADDDTEDWTANGRFATGLQWATLNKWTGHTLLQFLNLDGRWRRTSDSFLLP